MDIQLFGFYGNGMTFKFSILCFLYFIVFTICLMAPSLILIHLQLVTSCLNAPSEGSGEPESI